MKDRSFGPLERRTMRRLICFLVALAVSAEAKPSCSIPKSIASLVSPVKNSDDGLPDIRRNAKALKELCLYRVDFREGRLNWKMFLVFNPKRARGAFWFLPHDNENTAFDSAVYATRRYGGGFLAVASGGKRYHQGQDPNRNFSESSGKVPSCRYQKAPSPAYTRNVFRIINAFRGSGMPYLAMHNNTDGGDVSILKSSRKAQSFLAYPPEEIKRGRGLKDEDSLLYTAGRGRTPPRRKISRFLRKGINVKYEWVTPANNDCSMSNYVVLGRGSDNYYNIEAQHGDRQTQRIMVDKLMEIIMK